MRLASLLLVLVAKLRPGGTVGEVSTDGPQFCPAWDTYSYECNPHHCNCQQCGTGSCKAHLWWHDCHGFDCGTCWCRGLRCPCCYSSHVPCNCQTCHDTCYASSCPSSHHFSISAISHAIGSLGPNGHQPTVTITGQGFENTGAIRCWFLQPAQVPGCVWPNGKASMCPGVWKPAQFVDQNTLTCALGQADAWVPDGKTKNALQLEVSMATTVADGVEGNWEGLTNNGLNFVWYKCPQDCSGHGDCTLPTGTRDAAVCQCFEGYFGDGCAGICPGVRPGTPDAADICSGHGECSASGLCTCEYGFFGDACEQECPGGSGTPCSGHGSCSVSGQCICENDWRGETCSLHCPVTTNGICDGHGECNAAGSCGCQPGYFNEECSEECPGGFQRPCSGHGACLATGECLCDAGWVHVDCSNQGSCNGDQHCTCANPYAKFGPGCDEDCDCSMHGKCSFSGACDCDEGYWGPKCANICPGGVGADSCSGHGVCSKLDGTCTCHRGHGGTECNTACPTQLARASDTTWTPGTVTCQAVIDTYPGYYGRRRSIQGTVTVSNVDASGALKLDYDLSGLPAGSSGGLHIHAGHTCEDEHLVGRHYYTPNGPGDPDPWSSTYAVTSSQGSTQGSVEVTCGFRLEPSAPTVREHVVVVHNNAIRAEPSDRLGCGIIRCGRTDALPELCGGAESGTCNEEGHCVCNHGHWRPDCSGECPINSAGQVCNAHGNCSLVDGLCSCKSGWTGDGCQLTCPGNIDQGSGLTPCSGHGHCLNDGTCSCIKGYFNASCNGVCPGFDAHLGACSGHGTCSIHDGTCACQNGYFGEDCAGHCPLDNLGHICGGHGFCLSDGSCRCDYGWNKNGAGACTLQCPGGAANPCFGHGRCEDQGSCSCTPGYAGNDCNAPCPSSDPAVPPCNFPNGICQPANNTCTCNEPFGGADCTETSCPGNCNQRGVCHGSEGCRCEFGYYGLACEGLCPGGDQQPCGGVQRGVCDTLTGVCACFPGYFGEDCSETCPETAAGVCNLEGNCGEDGLCQCYSGWYGDGCESKMTSAVPASNVDIYVRNCRPNDAAWLFGMQEAIAAVFGVVPQRLDMKTCYDQSPGSALQVLPVEILGIPGRVTSLALAQNISAVLTATPKVLGEAFEVQSAEIHKKAEAPVTSDGISNGTIIGLLFGVAIAVALVVIVYFKWDAVQAVGRHVRRLVKTKIWGQQLDVDEDEGTMYGDGHTGAMHKANTEITYELDGAHAATDTDNYTPQISIPERVKAEPHANL